MNKKDRELIQLCATWNVGLGFAAGATLCVLIKLLSPSLTFHWSTFIGLIVTTIVIFCLSLYGWHLVDKRLSKSE